jgi:hypothetical protein
MERTPAEFIFFSHKISSPGGILAPKAESGAVGFTNLMNGGVL